MPKSPLRVGLFGFGCVGYGLYEVLQRTPNLQAEIVRICVKNPDKDRVLDKQCFSYDKDTILNDPEINVVVELIDDADAAFDIVSRALQKGKAVVSANKKMIAEHFDELLTLQRKYNVPLLYEAAACASIPIIRNLEEYFDNDLLVSISGIVNGSTNVILSRLHSNGLSYEESLRYAQAEGYTESNPILDIGGFDAGYKLVLLLAHAFGIVLKPEEIFTVGIQQLRAIDSVYAREKGFKIKLSAHAYRDGQGALCAFVMPQFVSSDNKFYGIDNVYNAVLTKTTFADTQFFVGKGAGAHPTASAVLSDLSALRYDYRYEYKKLNASERMASAEQIRLRVYCSAADNELSACFDYFERIEEHYRRQDDSFVSGVITLKSCNELLHRCRRLSLILLSIPERDDVIATSQAEPLQKYNDRSASVVGEIPHVLQFSGAPISAHRAQEFVESNSRKEIEPEVFSLARSE